MEESKITLTIFLMAVVTALPRVLPVWILAGREYPKALIVWLKYVPVAVISALLAPEIFLKDQKIELFSNLYFWVSLPTFAIAALTRNLFATIIVGMSGLALLRLFI